MKTATLVKLSAAFATFSMMLLAQQQSTKAAILKIVNPIDRPQRATFVTFFDGEFLNDVNRVTETEEGDNWKLTITEEVSPNGGTFQACDNLPSDLTPTFDCIKIEGVHKIALGPEQLPNNLLGPVYIDRFAIDQNGGRVEHGNAFDIGFGTFNTVAGWSALDRIVDTKFQVAGVDAIDIPGGTEWILESKLVHTPEPTSLVALLALGGLGLMSRMKKVKQGSNLK
ncbi:MAG: PEP-CTERM sorting domain-containing protein [Cyanobacteriota bacterium]|nr:PEP-CTERM sorting domain-containing protein [Cyanobacteriota bacterium]